MESKNNVYKKEIEELSKRCGILRKSHEKYLVLKEFHNEQNKEHDTDRSLISGATDELIIDANILKLKSGDYSFFIL